MNHGMFRGLRLEVTTMDIQKIERIAREARHQCGGDYIDGWYAIRDAVKTALKGEGVGWEVADMTSRSYAYATYEWSGWDCTWAQARGILESADPDAGWESAADVAEEHGFRD